MRKSFLSLLALFFLAAMSGSAQYTGVTGGGKAFDARQPTLAIRYIICTDGAFPARNDAGIGPVDRSQGMIGEIRTIADSVALPAGWAECDGRIIPISQNTALFSIIGWNYGGSIPYFAFPDLRGRVPIGAGQGLGLSDYTLGYVYGGQTTVNYANLPAHVHSTTNGNTGSAGGGSPLDIVQPALAVNFIITETGEVDLFAGMFAPDGWALCDGSVKNIADYPTLYGYITNAYGGDGTTTFQLPDLRGRTPVGVGQNSFYGNYEFAKTYGAESLTLSTVQMPSHSHTVTNGSTGFAGSSFPFSIGKPTLAMNWNVCISGYMPGAVFPWLGELRLSAGPSSALGSGWYNAGGYILAISQNYALYTCIGTYYGGNGVDSFLLPDMKGRVAVSIGQSYNSSNYFLGNRVGSETVTLTINEIPAHSHSLPTVPPSISCPANITTNNAPGQCTQTVSFAAVVTAGSPAPTVTYTLGTNIITSPYNFPVGTNIVTVTATNGTAPNENCSFTVIVNDTIPPVMNCPSPITVTNNAGYCPKVVTFNASATDCTLVSVYSVPSSGSAFPVGTNTVTTYATDAYGNSNSCSFTVTVLPGPQPQLTYALVNTNVVLSWSNIFSCYTLQSSDSFGTASNKWSAVPGSPVLTGGRYFFTNAPANTNRFFRLKY